MTDCSNRKKKTKNSNSSFTQTSKSQQNQHSVIKSKIPDVVLIEVTFGVLGSDGEGVLRSCALHAVCLDRDDPWIAIHSE